MTEQEILKLAEKIKSGTATAEEKLSFVRELNFILTSVKDDLKALSAADRK